MNSLSPARVHRSLPAECTQALRALLVVLACTCVAACGLRKTPDESVAQARSQFEEGKYRSAMSEAKSVLQRDPNHAQARILLAELSLWVGDLDGAEKELERAVKAGVPEQSAGAVRYEILLARARYDDVLASLGKDEQTPALRRLLLEARAQSGRRDLDQARRALSQALESSPNDPEALLEMARVDAAGGELQRALELIKKITQPELMKARAQMLQGSIYMLEGEHRQARDVFAQVRANGRAKMPTPEQAGVLISLTEAQLAIADVPAAEQTLSQLATWIPNSVAYHFLRARAAILKNDPVTAVAECQRALVANPRHRPSQMLLAAAHLSQGSFEQAEGVLNTLLSTDAANVPASKLLAQVYLGRGKPEEAQRILSAVAADSPPDGQLDWLLGQALLQSGDSSGLAALERSVATTPGDVARRVDLAAAYISARLPEKAIKLLELVPAESPQAQRAQALKVVASIAGKGVEEARAELERLVAADGDNVALLTAAAVQLIALGETVKSRAHLERAAELDKKAVEARWLLAQLAAGRQDFELSRKYLREILAIDPRNQRAPIGLSELAWRQGDRTGAQRFLEDAVGTDPTAVEARLRLAQMAFVAGDAARGRDLLAQTISAAVDRKTALNVAGRILARAGFAEEALTKFQEAGAAGSVEGVLNTARLHQQSGRDDEARQVLEAALVDAPGNRDVERLLIELDARAGRIDRAIARLHAMQTLAPAAMLEYEGDTYALGKEHSRAMAAYEEAQRKQPSGRLARKLFSARHNAGAPAPERSLTDWLRSSPGDAEIRGLLAAYYVSTQRPNEAMGEYERMLAADRIDPLSLNNLAWMLHERNDVRALALAKRAHEAAPQVAEITDTYGWILVQKDKVVEGLEMLERARAGAPANPDIQYHVAAAYAKSGRAARAGELLRELLQQHEKFVSREAAERLVLEVTGNGS